MLNRYFSPMRSSVWDSGRPLRHFIPPSDSSKGTCEEPLAAEGARTPRATPQAASSDRAQPIRECPEQVAAGTAVALDALLRGPDRPDEARAVGTVADVQVRAAAEGDQRRRLEGVRRSSRRVLQFVHPRQ